MKENWHSFIERQFELRDAFEFSRDRTDWNFILGLTRHDLNNIKQNKPLGQKKELQLIFFFVLIDFFHFINRQQKHLTKSIADILESASSPEEQGDLFAELYIPNADPFLKRLFKKHFKHNPVFIDQRVMKALPKFIERLDILDSQLHEYQAIWSALFPYKKVVSMTPRQVH